PARSCPASGEEPPEETMRTNYRLEGPADAPVVTLAHPLGATLEMWDAQVAALLPRHRVLRYDNRGHGGTEVPPGPYTLEQMADDLLALLNAVGIRETHFVGLSMGGLIGMTAALAYPDRITPPRASRTTVGVRAPA